MSPPSIESSPQVIMERKGEENGVHGFYSQQDFDPSAASPFRMAEIRATIPEHCWIKNPWRSMSYVLRNVPVISTLVEAVLYFNNWYFWPLYWVAQGTMFWASFVLGHDWSELLAHPVLLVLQHNQIPVRHVQAGEMIRSRLGVLFVPVLHECGAAGFSSGSDAYLTNWAVLAEYIADILAGDVEREVAHVRNAIHLRWKACVAPANCHHSPNAVWLQAKHRGKEKVCRVDCEANYEVKESGATPLWGNKSVSKGGANANPDSTSPAQY